MNFVIMGRMFGYHQDWNIPGKLMPGFPYKKTGSEAMREGDIWLIEEHEPVESVMTLSKKVPVGAQVAVLDIEEYGDGNKKALNPENLPEGSVEPYFTVREDRHLVWHSSFSSKEGAEKSFAKWLDEEASIQGGLYHHGEGLYKPYPVLPSGNYILWELHLTCGGGSFGFGIPKGYTPPESGIFQRESHYTEHEVPWVILPPGSIVCFEEDWIPLEKVIREGNDIVTGVGVATSVLFRGLKDGYPAVLNQKDDEIRVWHEEIS